MPARPPNVILVLTHDQGYPPIGAHFGKWHLGDAYPYRAQDRGFQHSVVHSGGGVGQTPDRRGNDYFDGTYPVDGVPTPFEGYCTDVFFDQALKFIEAQPEAPFFGFLSTNAPHSPSTCPRSFRPSTLARPPPRAMPASSG